MTSYSEAVQQRTYVLECDTTTALYLCVRCRGQLRTLEPCSIYILPLDHAKNLSDCAHTNVDAY